MYVFGSSIDAYKWTHNEWPKKKNEMKGCPEFKTILYWDLEFSLELKLKKIEVCAHVLHCCTCFFCCHHHTSYHKFMSKKKMNEWINLHRENSWCISINLISHRSLFLFYILSLMLLLFFHFRKYLFSFGRKK